MTNACGAFCALLGLISLPVVQAQTSLYATGTDGLYTINTATGATTALSVSSGANLADGGLAYDSADSTLYATGLDNSSHSAFYSLNPGTGAATEIAEISGGYSFDQGGLAYDSTHNVLYATGTNGGSSTSLFRINPSTGAASLIATTTTTTTTAISYPGPGALPSQISKIQTQLQELQGELATFSGPSITQIQNQINTVTNSLNTVRPNLNNEINQLNALVASALAQGAVVGTMTTITPIPVAVTTTNNFTLLGLGYKAATDTLYANGTIGGDVSGQGAAVFTLDRSTGAPTTLGYAGVTAGSSFFLPADSPTISSPARSTRPAPSPAAPPDSTRSTPRRARRPWSTRFRPASARWVDSRSPRRQSPNPRSVPHFSVWQRSALPPIAAAGIADKISAISVCQASFPAVFLRDSHREEFLTADTRTGQAVAPCWEHF